jgi:hypothetical protein
MKKKDKKPTKKQEDIIKMLHGMPIRVQLLGFYKRVPVFHDPKYPTPDGVLYFINEDYINIKKRPLKDRLVSDKLTI